MFHHIRYYQDYDQRRKYGKRRVPPFKKAERGAVIEYEGNVKNIWQDFYRLAVRHIACGRYLGNPIQDEYDRCRQKCHLPSLDFWHSMHNSEYGRAVSRFFAIGLPHCRQAPYVPSSTLFIASSIR